MNEKQITFADPLFSILFNLPKIQYQSSKSHLFSTNKKIQLELLDTIYYPSSNFNDNKYIKYYKLYPEIFIFNDFLNLSRYFM